MGRMPRKEGHMEAYYIVGGNAVDNVDGPTLEMARHLNEIRERVLLAPEQGASLASRATALEAAAEEVAGLEAPVAFDNAGYLCRCVGIQITQKIAELRAEWEADHAESVNDGHR